MGEPAADHHGAPGADGTHETPRSLVSAVQHVRVPVIIVPADQAWTGTPTQRDGRPHLLGHAVQHREPQRQPPGPKVSRRRRPIACGREATRRVTLRAKKVATMTGHAPDAP